MKFIDFLSELSRIQDPQALYVQGHLEAMNITRQVFVGQGRWGQEAGDNASEGPLLLTNKGAARHFGLADNYTSVTRFVLTPPAGYLESWNMWAFRPLAPADALSSMTLVVDDVSPDSVMAVLILLARLADVDLSEIPKDWVKAVDLWEQTGLASSPWHSWCALESALVHRCFPRQGPPTPKAFSLGWRDALRFLAKCIVLQLDPDNIPELLQVSEYSEAKAALEQEQEVYWDLLQRATPIQLSIPLIGATNRRMLVDGILAEAQQIAGAVKVFLRNDRENSPLGRGFSFLALYVPSCPGQDADITISVDPSRGVNLTQLWQAIEHSETKAWEDSGETRPTDFPRELEGVRNIFQEPWYIDPTQMLIGGPRKLKDGQPGSRLEWSDIREIIWRELNPLRGVALTQCLTGASVALLETCPEPEHSQHHKSFFAAKWNTSRDEDALLLPRAPYRWVFLLRVLAAKLHNGRPQKPVAFHELPPDSSWDLVKLDGGLAVVNHDGIFVLDDWHEQQLQIPEIREDFHRAAALDIQLLNLEKEDLRQLVEEVSKLIRRERNAPGVEVLLRRVAYLETRLAQIRGSFAMLPEGAEARLIRNAIEKRWLLDRRLCACESEIRAITTSLRNLSELSTLRIGRFISIYGFALILAAETSSLVAKAVYYSWRGAGRAADVPAVLDLGCFGIIALVFIMILRFWFAFEKPLKRVSRRSAEKDSMRH